ncbi:hypothetical protein PG593_03630 [Riemerella anatipestifer]|uniref:hypothetical protein n=1 Tax=Riemerella anatipestifer TaxID=34085 RepID=UPI0006994765|nr:hypothetical protein [Riemerella anatipestifer]MDR7693389.1 hypothetical protein [Riemerella anatipestifer]MDY3528870.1 hypothetical protein [Riemerella anatipestifer]MDY3538085.1 hypothetical protein [Riemerella anatipestifer]
MNNLPTNELKEYGIINEDNTFSKKLSENDIQRFLQGDSLMADNGKDRVVFQLKENNTRLEVNVYQRDKAISDILNEATKGIVYSSIEKTNEKLSFEKKAFIYDEKLEQVVEYDLMKNSEELTQKIIEREDIKETNRYREELSKLKNYLYDKRDNFPEIAKEITGYLNIVEKTINTIDDITPNESQQKKQKKSNIQLGINDPDLYQDANQKREENWEQEQEQKQKTRFKR